MTRLRRTRSASTPLPVAADVLEARALLSGAAAAVHAAVHHSQATTHGSAGAVTPSRAQLTLYQVTAQITLNGDATDVPAQLFIAPVPLKPGAHVTVNVGFVTNLGGLMTDVVAKLTGTVKSWGPAGVLTAVTLKAGGSIVLAPVGLPRSQIAKLVSTGAPLTIELDSTGKFVSLQTDFKTARSNPPLTYNFLCYTP